MPSSQTIAALEVASEDAMDADPAMVTMQGNAGPALYQLRREITATGTSLVGWSRPCSSRSREGHDSKAIESFGPSSALTS